VWTLNSDEGSFATHVEMAPKVTLDLLMEADDEAWPLRACGRRHALRPRPGDGADIGGGKTYQLKLDGAYKIADVQPFSDEAGVYAITWNLADVYDAASGLAFEATLRNTEISLSPPVT